MAQRGSGHELQLALLITPVRTDEGILLMVADILRLILSLVIICFAVVACLWAMYAGVTLMPQSLPNYAVFIIFFVSLFMLAVTEGLHVAAVQVAYQDHKQFLETHPRAAAIMEYQNRGRNLQHFLIGRQIIVLFSVFILGRCTTFNSFFDALPSWFESYVMFTGFLGVVLVVQIGQLVPQILSSNFPVDYLNLRVVHWVYYFCLFLEQTGICYTVWLICWTIHRCLGAEEEHIIDVSDKLKYLTHSDMETRVRILKNAEALRTELNVDDVERGHEAMEHTPLNIDGGDVKPAERRRLRFPSKGQCAQGFVDSEMKVPDFLLAEDHPDYIPPHIALMHLLSRQSKNEP